MAREKPDISDDEFDKQLHERVKENMEAYNREIAELAKAQFKEARDRKSDPETVCRNIEICDRRRQDPKKWSFGKLAKTYGMTRQSIVNITKEEEKWRRLAAQM